MTVKSHRDLLVWQKAMQLATEVYRLAKLMPKAEEYRLTGQMLRAAASVAANVAEGNCRGTRKDYALRQHRPRLASGDGDLPIVGNFGWVAAREGDGGRRRTM